MALVEQVQLRFALQQGWLLVGNAAPSSRSKSAAVRGTVNSSSRLAQNSNIDDAWKAKTDDNEWVITDLLPQTDLARAAPSLCKPAIVLGGSVCGRSGGDRCCGGKPNILPKVCVVVDGQFALYRFHGWKITHDRNFSACSFCCNTRIAQNTFIYKKYIRLKRCINIAVYKKAKTNYFVWWLSARVKRSYLAVQSEAKKSLLLSITA